MAVDTFIFNSSVVEKGLLLSYCLTIINFLQNRELALHSACLVPRYDKAD